MRISQFHFGVKELLLLLAAACLVDGVAWGGGDGGLKRA